LRLSLHPGILNSRAAAKRFRPLHFTACSRPFLSFPPPSPLSTVSVSGTALSVSGLGLPLSLAAGQSTSFSVLFAPTTTGALSGTVTITSNASDSPMTIALSGTGGSSTPPALNLSWTPSSSTYASFNVYRASASGGPYTKLNSSSAPSFSDSTISSGHTYHYVVTELDTSGNQSTYSNQATAVVP
jgi:centrosomal CEP192-like protein